jgi:hypothetical protein
MASNRYMQTVKTPIQGYPSRGVPFVRLAPMMSVPVKGFGCRPLEGQRREFGGRRPKASKGGNRAGGTWDRTACSI